eukprot:TRINITY_DN5708_c0_g1_i2.p1 TRINITY_DN5708_c0_g1~~TRINITY_DN5708_c0_g1_i2.p1  ORF type:complete len:575 (-),score=214.15 TRINITY_DN5708_c0_g1_i2:109-1833(-)
MQSSSSSEEERRGRHHGSKSPHRRGHHGKSGRHGSRSHEKGKECWKIFREHKEGRGEVKVAVAIMCQDMQPIHQAVMARLIKAKLKGERKSHKEEEHKKHHGGSKERKERFTAERVKEVTKELLKDKESIIESVELIMGVLHEERMKMFPQGEEAKVEEVKTLHHGHKRFAREVAELISEMRCKGITDKEQQKEMAKKSLEKMRKRHKKDMTRGTKKIVKKILFYELENCDPLYRKVVEGVVSDAFTAHCFMKMAHKRRKMVEMMGKFEARTEEGEQTEFRGRGGMRGRGFGGFRGHGWRMHGMHEGPWGHHMRGGPMEHFAGKHHGAKFMRTMFQDFMLKKGLKFVLCYYKENAEDMKACYEAAKGEVEAYFKAINKPEEYRTKAMSKALAEIISGALRDAGEDKKTKDFYVDYAQRYIKGCVTPCHKGCVKRCERLMKAGLRFDGAKDKTVIGVASRWGAVACCQANGKTGCSEDLCAEFSKKWIAAHLPVVAEAVATAKEMANELLSERFGEGKGERFIGMLTLKYLTMHCPDGKFNKDDFKKFMKERKEKVDKMFEKMKSKCKSKKTEAS